MVCRLTRLVTASALVVALASTAQAQSAAADALFQEAVQLAKDGDFAAAADKFKASYALEPARGALQGLAMAEEKLGRVASAYARYRELVEVSARAGDDARVKVARARLDALEPRLPKLIIEVTGQAPPGAELRLNGAPLAVAALGTPLPLDPGEQRLEGTAPNGATARATATLVEGQVARVSVSWSAPAADPASAGAASPPAAVAEGPGGRPSEQRAGSLATVGWITAGAGVLIGAAGAYFYVKSGSTFDDVKAECDGNRCPESARSLADEGKRDERIGQLGIILGSVALATGVSLVLLGPRDRARRSGRVTLTVDPHRVSLGGSF